MDIKGIGIDIIEIERVAKSIKRHGRLFLERLFTAQERLPVQLPADPALSEHYIATYYAGRFAAKEAIVKAFGTGFRGIHWQDIEVLSDDLGKPYVTLSPKVSERFDNPTLLITISHSKANACAFCIWQG